MAGTWTTPRTWVDGETPTGAQFNTQLRDQLVYLKDSPTFDGNPVVSGTLTVGGNVNAGLDLVASRNLGVSGTAYITGDVIASGSLSAAGSVTLGDNIADTVNMVGLIIGAPFRNYSETRTAIAAGGGYLVVDCNIGTYFTVTTNQDFTVAPRNPPPAGRAYGVTIIFIGDGAQRNVYWEASIKWPTGIAPVITPTAGRKDMITLVTEDGGTTWFGVIVGQNY